MMRGKLHRFLLWLVPAWGCQSDQSGQSTCKWCDEPWTIKTLEEVERGPVTMEMAERFEKSGHFALADLARRLAVDKPKRRERTVNATQRNSS